MIVYRELSSLAFDLGLSAKTLYSASNRLSAHYRSVRLPKGNGEYRKLSVPDDLLKSIQTRINRVLLSLEDVSVFASAYKPGGSTKKNAAPHVGKPVLLKLDIHRFFDSVTYCLVKEKVFPAERFSEQNRILLSLLCTYDNALPQGAPTSPAISNIILREFDQTVGQWCRQSGIAYTRYCDDMTFSGDFETAPVIEFVGNELRKMGFFLNGRKTATARLGQRQCVTGIVVNQKIGVPAAYKKRIRQEIYYCNKYGIDAHLQRTGAGESRQTYGRKLLGKIHYVLSVEPRNSEMQAYREQLARRMADEGNA